MGRSDGQIVRRSRGRRRRRRIYAEKRTNTNWIKFRHRVQKLEVNGGTIGILFFFSCSTHTHTPVVSSSDKRNNKYNILLVKERERGGQTDTQKGKLEILFQGSRRGR